ncbi:MAG: ADP-ribosylglycohydrolase family protein [Planctomycetes bacterium]|nr:ADP-ribosylglycohydrolase family protein [Planctomycetota bacterium]
MSRNLPSDHEPRIDRVRLALDGLWTGDCMGQQFFDPQRRWLIEHREPTRAPWPHTDDTEMALSICEVLQIHGRIEQDELAQMFARRYRLNADRGYGAMAHKILTAIHHGEDWREAAGRAFDGQGSMGNGGAMRVAPVGAYFADDFDQAAAEAEKSAEVTHSHREGKAGAIAVAVAAAWAWRHANGPTQARGMLESVFELVPAGETRNGIERALSFDDGCDEMKAAALLGNGSRIIAQDTVPFALWCARRHLGSYEDAIWAAIRVGGDFDTNCAIVGGIVALATGLDGIPKDWRDARE